MIQTLTEPAPKAKDVYWEKFDQFQRDAATHEPEWLTVMRRAAVARFSETGFPSLHDEDWRFTNVAPIAKLPFIPLFKPSGPKPSADVLATATFNRLTGSKLVFVNGHYAPDLSFIRETDGLEVASLGAALRREATILQKHLTQHTADNQNPFLALNTAFFTDGALVRVPAGRVILEPVQLLHITTSALPGATVHLRHLIVAEKGSAVTVVENYIGTVSTPYFTNAATTLVVGEGARVEHCKLQREALGGFHMAAVHADLASRCNFLAHSIALGARLSRNNIRTVLAGEGVECILNGLYLTKDDQLADHHMIVDHAKPHCASHEYFNGILDDRSRGVFHGRILVRPDAQKTDAKQTNKNLLLSDEAVADAKPQLEIYADDVKCTHGATVGQLNEESIFYLRARGIGQEMARRMLMHAFAGEIIDRIRYRPVGEELDRLIWNQLEQNKRISVAN